MNIQIGNFEQVKNLEEIWPEGHAGFVAWLSRPENLKLLSDFIGLKMELVNDEQLRKTLEADLLCHATEDGGGQHTVAIQTRLGNTTSDDLSKILSHVGSTDRLTFVWVATPFDKKHKKALDNLNDITKDNVNFFGVELGMWRIGKSDPAIWLDVVSKPKGSGASAGSSLPSTGASASDKTEQSQASQSNFVASIGPGATPAAVPQEGKATSVTQDYWQNLRDRITQRSSVLSLPNPTSEEWTSYDIGCNNFYLIAVVHFSQPSSISVALVCQGPEARRNFSLLQKQKEKIEWEVGVNLEWLDSPGRPFPHVVLVKSADPSNQSAWQNQHDWLVSTLEKFDAAFRPRAKMIDSSSAQSG